MKRVFIPIESVTVAHVARPLQIAKVLRDRGVEVIFGMGERYRWLIEEAGFETRPLYCADSEVLLGAVRSLNFSEQTAHLPYYFKSDLITMRALGDVDLVLADFRFTVRLSAECLGIPHVAITNGYYTPYYSVLPELPEAIAGAWPAAFRRFRPLRSLIRAVVPKFHALPYQKLSRKYHLKTEIRSGFDIAVSNALTLICDVPEFTPQKNLPKHYQFIGPILWEPENHFQPLPEEFDGKRRPLVYITLGTSGEHGILQDMIKAFEKSEYDAVISTGAKDQVYLSENIFAVPFVQASQVLKKANLMICHGGNGSIYQALSFGIPVLCVTTFYDQEWNGQRVRELGLGESLFHSHLKKTAILPLAKKIMNDEKIRTSARNFKMIMARWNGPELAAQKILDLIGAPSENRVV